jgi:hypothetical protein
LALQTLDWRRKRRAGSKFPLQTRACFGTFEAVRTIIAIGTLFIGISTAFAQEQESRLMDRLLKPDSSLANPAQNRHFAGERMASFDKPARTKSFYSSQKPVLKTSPDVDRAFTPRQFAARHFRAGDSSAYINSRSQLTKNDTVIATAAATAGTRVAPESNQTTPVREYAGNRPFLDKGKSAKSLQAQNKPLTLEQVRELLNKNK